MTSVPAERWAGVRENRSILLVGAAGLALLFILTATNAAGQAGLWENAHWTWAAAIATILAIRGIADPTRPRSIAIIMAAGMLLTLVGQLIYDGIIAFGFVSVPAAYDLVFLAAYPLVAGGLFLGARRVLSAAEVGTLLIDSAIAVLTVSIVILAVFEQVIVHSSLPVSIVVIAYPVVFLGTSAATLFAALAMRGSFTGPGLLIISAGSALVAMDWIYWLSEALKGPLPVGSGPNYLWSIGVLLTGLGIVSWRFHPGLLREPPDLGVLRGLAPMAAVVLALTVLVLDNPAFNFIFEILIAMVVLLAAVRQTILVMQREQLAMRERQQATRADLERAATSAALAAQRASEERYRRSVEVFDRLADQIGIASDEEHILRVGAAAMRRLVPTDRGDMLVVSPSKDRLVVAASWGADAPEVGEELQEPPVRCLGIRRGSPYAVADAADDLLLACPAHPATAGSVLCVPLIALGDTVGVAHLERSEPHAFAEDAGRQASRIAEQVALAVANVRLMQTMKSLALTDPLTRLHNARFFDPFLDRELATAQRDGQPLAVIMIDLDHFKDFNDTYGHAAGDDALRAFAQAALSATRDSDTIARYGGEEFIVAARNADLAGGAQLAERIRHAVERSPVELGPGRFARFTASFGVASTETHGMDRRTLINAADQALYRAKRGGRNRVQVAAADEGGGRRLPEAKGVAG